MRRRIREAFEAFAVVLDRIEAECLECERKFIAGEQLTPAEMGQYARWVSEGRLLWRKNRRLRARVIRAARKAGRNG